MLKNVHAQIADDSEEEITREIAKPKQNKGAGGALNQKNTGKEGKKATGRSAQHKICI